MVPLGSRQSSTLERPHGSSFPSEDMRPGDVRTPTPQPPRAQVRLSTVAANQGPSFRQAYALRCWGLPGLWVLMGGTRFSLHWSPCWNSTPAGSDRGVGPRPVPRSGDPAGPTAQPTLSAPGRGHSPTTSSEVVGSRFLTALD